MSVKVANNRFMVFSLGGFYQQILNTALSFQELGDRTVRQAEASFYLRQVNVLKELGLLLTRLPIKEYQLIGQYYVGWCEYYEGANERRTFEHVLENSTLYRPKALMSLAAIEARKGDYASEAYYFTKAKKYANDVTTLIKACKGVAVVKAKEGFRASALKDLESALPLIRHAEPFVYFDFLNSYATELGEAGRKQEARNIADIVLRSPFAHAYPEWQETANDLRGSSRSFAVIDPSPPNSARLYSMPLPQRHEATMQDKPASVINLQLWKKKMGKEPDGNDSEGRKDVEQMTFSEMLLEIIKLSSDKTTTEEELREMLIQVRKVISQRKKK